MKRIKVLVSLLVIGLLTSTSLLFVATAPLALTGCVAPAGGGTNNQAAIDATALILQSAARSGAIAAITPPTGDSNNAAYFNLAAQAIGVFLTGKDYSPAAFQQALVAIKIPQANNVWVQLGISAVIDLYQVYYSQYVQGQINGNASAGEFLKAVQDGFNQALGNPVSAHRPTLKTGTPVGLLPRPVR